MHLLALVIGDVDAAMARAQKPPDLERLAPGGIWSPHARDEPGELTAEALHSPRFDLVDDRRPILPQPDPEARHDERLDLGVQRLPRRGRDDAHGPPGRSGLEVVRAREAGARRRSAALVGPGYARAG